VIARSVNVPSRTLRDPGAVEWTRLPQERLEMVPTPLDQQPTEFLRTVWEDQEFGAVKELRVRAAHNGVGLFFQLEWDDPTQDTETSDIDVFTDGAGILFPLRGDAPIESMGSDDQPVNAWYWRADFGGEPKNVTASSTGSSVRLEAGSLRVRSRWSDARWTVVFGRAFTIEESPDIAVPLAPGKTTKVGFAIWEGGSGERGGFKAFSEEWQELEIQA
jgi:DMSO reductase family type II enzyme heme b subunit